MYLELEGALDKGHHGRAIESGHVISKGIILFMLLFFFELGR